ncbi:MAG: pyridoxal-phosphate-dependent aminotransferase family protein [Acidobacteriota bacterium]
MVKGPPFQTPPRTLLGPGPSQVPASVLQAMASPLMGHLDPGFLALMDRVQGQLRQVFGTTQRMTLPISGTGSAGIECALANLVEEGDRVVIGVAGLFGRRMVEMTRRLGGMPVPVESAWGTPVDVDRLPAQVRKSPTALVALVQAETSTGVLQSLEGLGPAVHEMGSLLMVDAVTSLGGLPVDVDRHEIDICVSASQKCLSAPPGLSPLTMGDRALEKVRRRVTPCRSWYLDLALLDAYWGEERAYHHTAPISMIYALAAALDLVLEEGLPARYARHLEGHHRLVEGLQELGLDLLPRPAHRLPVLNAVRVPERVEERGIRSRLLERWGIEIGGGLGDLAGLVWRVGLMGESNRFASVDLFLAALADCLGKVPLACPPAHGRP